MKLKESDMLGSEECFLSCSLQNFQIFVSLMKFFCTNIRRRRSKRKVYTSLWLTLIPLLNIFQDIYD
jgi:hypothetical protein